jgi:CheY-like chemotaxis protein
MYKYTADFMIIDDDPINNMICTKVIEMTCPGTTVYSFTDPREALSLLISDYLERGSKLLTVFLDINMPLMSGWELLDRINEYSDHLKLQMKIMSYPRLSITTTKIDLHGNLL